MLFRSAETVAQVQRHSTVTAYIARIVCNKARIDGDHRDLHQVQHSFPTRRSSDLAWVLQAPGITAPIIGATRLSQLDDAVAALNLKLSPDEIATLQAPYVPHAVVGFS